MTTWRFLRACGQLALVLCLSTAPAVAAPTAQAVVEAFVKGEYAGEVDMRLQHAAWLRTRHGRTVPVTPTVDNGGVISLLGDPILVVDAMEQGPLMVDGARASVKLTVTVVANTIGEGVPGRKMQATPRHAQTVVLRLRRIDGVWKLANPGPPLVSLEALQKHYEAQDIAAQIAVADRRASSGQRLVARLIRDDWETLKTISRGKPPALP